MGRTEQTLEKGLGVQAGISGRFEKAEGESQGEKRGRRDTGVSSIGLLLILQP